VAETRHIFIQLWQRLREDSGQDLVEYMLLTSLISVGIVAVSQPLAAKVLSFFVLATKLF